MNTQKNVYSQKEDRSVADDIGEKVRLLCWVDTLPENHINAIHVKETWGKRCNILLFMSTEEDTRLPTVKLPVEDDIKYLWDKHKLAFQYIYDNYLEEAEWFLKADDDTFIIVENLKYLLKNYDDTDKIFFGSSVISLSDKYQNKSTGGTDYVLSREAMKVYMTKGLSYKSCDLKPVNVKDINLAPCLQKLGVIPIDTRDKYERENFFVSIPDERVQDEKNQVYRHVERNNQGQNISSEYVISFHHVDGNMMYILEYFVYHVRPFGISYKYQEI